MYKIAVIGAGSWGIAVSQLLSKNGHKVTIYCRNEKQVASITRNRKYDKLPGLSLDKSILIDSDLESVASDKDIIIFAIPSVAFREVVNNTFKYISGKECIVTLTKGMEEKTLYTMSEIITDELKRKKIKNTKVVALSGPTHAEEVAIGFPTMAVSASKNLKASKLVQDVFMNDYFRVYTNTDIKGVEICAAFKNIIAIVSGLITGLGFGDNIKAATLTRGLVEMIRVGKVFNCKKDTFYGLAGVGDMFVTATSTHSRNYCFGKLIGEGYKVEDAIKKIGMVVEGYNFIPKAMKIKRKYNLDLPITNGIYEIIFNKKDPQEIMGLLMKRSKKSE